MSINRGLYQGEVVPGALPFGVYEVYNETVIDVSLAAGTSIFPFTAVPAGELWVITHVWYHYVGTPPTNVIVFANDGSVYSYISFNSNVVSGGDNNFYPNCVLPPGGFIRFQVSGATLNDDFRGSVHGYKMRITS